MLNIFGFKIYHFPFTLFPEKNLRAEGQLFGINHKHYSGHYFVGLRPEDIGIYGKIDDDHVPFMERGMDRGFKMFSFNSYAISKLS